MAPGKIDTGAITRLENLVRSIHERPATLSARVERLRKEVEVSAGEQDTTFEAAGELDALRARNKALTELMRLVAGDGPSSPTAEASLDEATDPTAGSAASAGGEAARKHAVLVAEAEATYNAATEKWRALRDARLDAPGNVRAAEMGAVRTSRRRVKQQMAERAREARGEPAPRPRIHARDASADASPRPAIAPPPPPPSPASPLPGVAAATAQAGWSW